jgi:hypothetical protein
MESMDRLLGAPSEMYGPPRDCKGKSVGRETCLRKCIRPFVAGQQIWAKRVSQMSAAKTIPKAVCFAKLTVPDLLRLI